MSASHTGRKGSGLDRLLSIVSEVRPGEGSTALLLALNVFLILTAYYVLKPVREALILGEGTAALKSYLSAGEVVLLALFVPFYGRLVARLPRMRLINRVTAFFALAPVLFYLLARTGTLIAIPYFLWIGIFNLVVIAQFWSFANDLYSKDEGERLFPIVGFGASLGAVLGSRIADRLIEPLGVDPLMLVGAALLGGQLLLTNAIDRREGHRVPTVASVASRSDSKGNAFSMVFQTRYLLLMALLLMVANWVSSMGGFILSTSVKETATEMVASGRSGGLSVEDLIGDFYSKYYSLVNVLGLLLQLFVVSRVVKHFGVPVAVAILPVLALAAFGVIALFPVLRAVLAAKVAENATEYSLNNTVRNMLFLPCTPEQKYSAKQVIDSFFVRLGDVGSAQVVFLGSTFWNFSSRGFAAATMPLALIWLFLAWRVGADYRRLSAEERPRRAASSWKRKKTPSAAEARE